MYRFRRMRRRRMERTLRPIEALFEFEADELRRAVEVGL